MSSMSASAVVVGAVSLALAMIAPPVAAEPNRAGAAISRVLGRARASTRECSLTSGFNWAPTWSRMGGRSRSRVRHLPPSPRPGSPVISSPIVCLPTGDGESHSVLSQEVAARRPRRMWDGKNWRQLRAVVPLDRFPHQLGIEECAHFNNLVIIEAAHPAVLVREGPTVVLGRQRIQFDGRLIAVDQDIADHEDDAFLQPGIQPCERCGEELLARAVAAGQRVSTHHGPVNIVSNVREELLLPALGQVREQGSDM